MEERMSHVDAEGRARMVDVSAKTESVRRAVAGAVLEMSPGTLQRVLSGDLPKGPVLETARLAGVMAAKGTSGLIPLCHPVRISDVRVELAPAGEGRLEVRAEVSAVDRTGVEMEALCAAAVAALTVYDMVKAVDRGMVVQGLRLLRKEGGRSGTWVAEGGEV